MVPPKKVFSLHAYLTYSILTLFECKFLKLEKKKQYMNMLLYFIDARVVFILMNLTGKCTDGR